MTPKFGYALVHRDGIVAAGDEGRIIYCIYKLEKEARAAQQQYQHTSVVRVRIEADK